jgi:hypothetical protein
MQQKFFVSPTGRPAGGPRRTEHLAPQTGGGASARLLIGPENIPVDVVEGIEPG